MLLARGKVEPDLLTPVPSSEPVSDGLWISSYGTMMAMPSIYLAIKTRTKAAFGFVVNPHRFRHCSTTSAAIKDLDHARMSMALLGHTTTATAQRYYNGAPATANTGHYQNSILALRENLRGKTIGGTKASAHRLPSRPDNHRHEQPSARAKVPVEMQDDGGAAAESAFAIGHHDCSTARHAATDAAPSYWRRRKNQKEQRR